MLELQALKRNSLVLEQMLTAAGKRWGRMVLRLAVRLQWHWRGILLWLVQRPHLRVWPLPLPGVETPDQHLQQTGSAVAPTRKLLLELVELRNKLGIQTAFMENTELLQAILLARSRAGVMGRMRRAARQEEQPEAASQPAVTRLGPRGGLPRTKPELQALCAEMGLSAEGKVDELKTRLREFYSGTQHYDTDERRRAVASGGSRQSQPPVASALPVGRREQLLAASLEPRRPVLGTGAASSGTQLTAPSVEGYPQELLDNALAFYIQHMEQQQRDTAFPDNDLEDWQMG